MNKVVQRCQLWSCHISSDSVGILYVITLIYILLLVVLLMLLFVFSKMLAHKFYPLFVSLRGWEKGSGCIGPNFQLGLNHKTE